MKSVTLKDVAKAAGVSYATVSRALSGSPQIGSETRERIIKLCDEMGYTTNYVARSMVMKKTDLIGLVVPSIDNQFMSELGYYAEMSARSHGYNIMLCDSGPDLRQEINVVKLLLGRQVDGILIVPQNSITYEHIAAYIEDVPTVFLSENLRDQPQSYVAIDNSRGTFLGTEYLYRLGHREILYFGCRDSTTHRLRAEGYQRACQKFGLRERILHSEFPRSSIENGYQMAKALFEKPIDYTAIFASTDSNALGIMRAADEMDIQIPEQLSLMGFDNISASALSRIDLTTVEQSKREMATQAVDTYEEKDRIELQFIGSTGRIQMSTSGLTAGSSPGTSDITSAIANQEIRPYQGRDPETGEKILAVSAPLLFNGRVAGVMRLVTSLKLVDRQIVLVVFIILAVGVICMALVLISSLLFINNVVEPVAVVTDAAKRISAGSYGFQIENKYTDELGELVDNINDMSLKIGQNEKMKSEFISSVSHELRTPLTAINGWGETILEDPNDDPAQMRRGIRIILNEARRLSTMVEELLEFSKMEDGRFTLHMEQVDLQAEFEVAIFTYRELFRQEGIELTYESGDEDLPPIPGDSERLKQVFCNVLDNAAKHGGAGKRIDASISREGEFEVVRVRDYGPGVPEAELPFIKQKFYKGSSKARGSGIGLAVCDEIVGLHNGIFTIGNADGGGAVVTICLPVKE